MRSLSRQIMVPLLLAGLAIAALGLLLTMHTGDATLREQLQHRAALLSDSLNHAAMVVDEAMELQHIVEEVARDPEVEEVLIVLREGGRIVASSRREHLGRPIKALGDDHLEVHLVEALETGQLGGHFDPDDAYLTYMGRLGPMLQGRVYVADFYQLGGSGQSGAPAGQALNQHGNGAIRSPGAIDASQRPYRGIVLVRLSQVGVNAALATILWQLAAVFLGSIAITILTAYVLLNRHALRPLAQFGGFMERQRAGAGPGPMPDLGSNEIGRLGEEFCRLMESGRRSDARNDLLARVIEQATESVEVTDGEACIQYVNPAFTRITGYSLEEAVGRSPAALLRPVDARPEMYDEIWQTISSGRVWSGEFTARRKDGSIWQLDANISPVVDENGKVTHYIAIKRDITKRHELEAQLRAAHRMEAVGQLTAGVAHDFNNLLAVMMGNLELTLEQAGGPAAQRIVEAMAAAEKAAQLTRRLLAYSRQQTLMPQSVHVDQLIDGMSDMLRRTLGEAVQVTVSVAEDTSSCVVDVSQLENAILNLAINARDAMPGGGRLTIECGNAELGSEHASIDPEVQPGDYVLIAVSDTGVGMAPEILERVMEPFFTTKEFGQGSGLGLSMVYGFVKQSQGHVTIYSEPGQGTTVRLYLPRQASADAAEPVAAQRPPAPGGRGERVLAVEDNAEVRGLVTTMLANLGYDVVVADSATAALEILQSEAPFDLMLTDIVLPGGMDGHELVRCCRELRPGLPAVLMSGYSGKAMDGVAADGVPLVEKPFRRAEIARVLRGVLDRQADAA